MQRNAGFSLVEVLVSIVILSIGLLGTAGLMSASLRNTNTAYYRSQATVLADDIIDRMRANPVAARNGNYDIDLGPAYAAGAGTMARFDAEEWVDSLAIALPGGVGIVDVVPSGVATITIRWGGDGDGANEFITQSQL